MLMLRCGICKSLTCDEAVRVVSYSMRDNPVNVRAFCREGTEQPPRSLIRFFRPVLRGLYKRGVITGAFRDNALVGVCGMARPGSCQPTLLEKLEVLPSLVFGNPRGTTVRVLRWTGEWARRDPIRPHWHLGPVAVDSHLKAKESVELCCRPSVSEWTKSTRSRTWRPINLKMSASMRSSDSG